jgi:uncharacterized protein (DUF433 family)
MPTVKEIKHPYITKKRGIQGGRPVIAETRIPVSTVIFWYKTGKEIHEILNMYPHLTPSQIHDALSYYYDHQKEIEEEIAAVQDEDRWKKQYPPGKGSAHSAKR